MSFSQEGSSRQRDFSIQKSEDKLLGIKLKRFILLLTQRAVWSRYGGYLNSVVVVIVTVLSPWERLLKAAILPI